MVFQARRQLNWNGGGGMDSQYKLLSELLSDQVAFITSPKTSLANYWGALPPAPQCLQACGFQSIQIWHFCLRSAFQNIGFTWEDAKNCIFGHLIEEA